MSDSDEEKSDSTDSDEDDETSGSTDSDDDDDEVTRREHGQLQPAWAGTAPERHFSRVSFPQNDDDDEDDEDDEDQSSSEDSSDSDSD